MGGPGSTRWNGHTRRPTVEEFAAVRVRAYAEGLHDALARWTRAGRSDVATWLRARRDARAAWRLGSPLPRSGVRALEWCRVGRDPVTGRRVAMGAPRVRLAVEAVAAPLGGVRWWWRCFGCGRRCATLYESVRDGRPLLRHARCRRCLGLAYKSQRLGTEDRLRYRTQRLAWRVRFFPACLFDALQDRVTRPKGMKRSRFARESEKLERARLPLVHAWVDSMRRLDERIERMGARMARRATRRRGRTEP